ncbi:hypothetical protein EUTSA_v10000471mg, partial [Eutrema salsugineum]
EDRISQLPDSLLCKILGHLPAKEAVKTSVLSTRWKSLWLWAPSLELDSNKFPDFNAFASLGDRFFDSNRVSCIDKLELKVYESDNDDVEDYVAYFTSWIDAAVKRKVQHLHVVSLPDEYSFEIPISLYISQTLAFLKLQLVALVSAESFSLPCLKTMHLEEIWFQYPNETTFERLVSSCPVLEELKIIEFGNAPNVFRVHSFSLKRLEIKIRYALTDDYLNVVIDAPLLRWLRIDDCLSERYMINNLDSGAKLDISLSFGELLPNEETVSSKRYIIRDLLPRISEVGEMIMYLDIFKVIHYYSKLEPLPHFGYMSRLDITLCVSDLKWLPTFLEHCPNLKSLVLKLDTQFKEIHSEEMKQIRFSHVPQCLLSSL